MDTFSGLFMHSKCICGRGSAPYPTRWAHCEPISYRYSSYSSSCFSSNCLPGFWKGKGRSLAHPSRYFWGAGDPKFLVVPPWALVVTVDRWAGAREWTYEWEGVLDKWRSECIKLYTQPAKHCTVGAGSHGSTWRCLWRGTTYLGGRTTETLPAAWWQGEPDIDVITGVKVHYLLPLLNMAWQQHYNVCPSSSHNRQLPAYTGQLTDANFITPLLYLQELLLNLLLTLYCDYHNCVVCTILSPSASVTTNVFFSFAAIKDVNERVLYYSLGCSISVSWVNNTHQQPHKPFQQPFPG